MYQSFDVSSDPGNGAERARMLRTKLAELGLTGFMVPRSDEHQGEYVPAHAERLAWLTGFSGSAGVAVVLADVAAVFVDGRYVLQVEDQVDTAVFTPVHLTDQPVSKWLQDHLKAGDRLAIDPWLHTVAEVRRLKAAAEKAGAEIVAIDDNPLDAVWADQPEPPVGAVIRQPDNLAGEDTKTKIARIGEAIAEAQADVAVLTQPDSIAWLLNIRGSDVPHNPVPLSFAVVPAKGQPKLYIDGRKLDNQVRAYLEDHCQICPVDRFNADLREPGQAGKKVLLAPQTTSEAIRIALAGAGGEIIEGRDPIELPKAIKNPAELAGAQSAHLRDGAAIARFLCWLYAHAGSGDVDEISAAKQLEAFRAETGALKDISFDTISGAGANGAIVHYRVNVDTNARLEPGSLYLVDSGAQYQDGTTDITRTVAIGTPTPEMIDRFTRVLKGHIAIATARFPVGATGAQLDTLARLALWKAGLDFDHGTGHGVGSYLSVHEGPQRISKLGNEPLQAGMIISNEPGYYKQDAFGIRIENLEVVCEPADIDGGDRPMMGFETLTLAPIDQRLVDGSLLTADEVSWLDEYHRRVMAEVGPLVDDEVRLWLAQATSAVTP